MSEDMKPTPIEKLNILLTPREFQDELEGPYREIVARIARESMSEEKWKLLYAKMAHDGAMRRTLFQLEGQERDRRIVTRLAWWGLGTMTVILLVIATQCTGHYGGTILDDPDHYSRQH